MHTPKAWPQYKGLVDSSGYSLGSKDAARRKAGSRPGALLAAHPEHGSGDCDKNQHEDGLGINGTVAVIGLGMLGHERPLLL